MRQQLGAQLVICTLVVLSAKAAGAQLRTTDLSNHCSTDGWCRVSPYLPEMHMVSHERDAWLIVEGHLLYRRVVDGQHWERVLPDERYITDVATDGRGDAWILAPQCHGNGRYERTCSSSRIYHWTKTQLVKFELKGHLRSIWSAGNGTVWAAGGDDRNENNRPDESVHNESLVVSWNGHSWHTWPIEVSPRYQNGPLLRIWGTSASDVWAIGGGTIQRWNGSKWRGIDYPTKDYIPKMEPTNHSTRQYTDIYGSAGDVWIGEDYGPLRHFNAKGDLSIEPDQKRPEPQFPADLPAAARLRGQPDVTALSVASERRVWVASAYGSSYFDGNEWHGSSYDDFGPEEMLIQASIVANEANQALMLRVNGPHIYAGQEPSWKKLQPPNKGRLDLCVLGSSPGGTPLVVSCAEGSLYEWNYPFKHPLRLLAKANPRFAPKAIWSSSVNDVWVVALRRPQVYRFDRPGKKLKPVVEGLPERCSYRAVSGTAPNDVWLVGDAGCIAHFDGNSWSEVPSGFDERLSGVWAATPSRAWAVGVGGTILGWNGKTWHRQEGDTLRDLLAISGSSAHDVWIVGEGGTILHRSVESP